MQDGCTLTAHVRGIDAAEAGGFSGKRDQFFGLGVGSRRIFERSGDTDGAVEHGLADEFFHLLELRRLGLYIVVAEDHAADAGGADVIGDIDADALFFKASKVLAKGSPVGLHVELIEGALIGTENGVIERSDAFPFAGDLRGDALIDFRWQTRIDENGEFGLTKHINKAGGDNETVSVDGARARCCGEVADCGDSSFANPDVTGIPRRTSAVYDLAIGDDNVERRGQPGFHWKNNQRKKEGEGCGLPLGANGMSHESAPVAREGESGSIHLAFPF